MIERFVFVKLKSQYGEPQIRQELLADTLEIFSSIPQVVSVRAGLPADQQAEQAWDLAIVVGFRSLDDIPAYRASAPHVRFIDEVLGDRKEVLKAWSFDMRSA